MEEKNAKIKAAQIRIRAALILKTKFQFLAVFVFAIIADRSGNVFRINARRLCLFVLHRTSTAAAIGTATFRSVLALLFHWARTAFAAAVFFVAARSFCLSVGSFGVHSFHRARINRRFV
jgi:hypothetical protein